MQTHSKRYTPYPAYKPSNVAWLGDIPAHWEVKRLKFTIDGCQNGMWGDEPNGTTDDIICIRVADFDRITSRVRNAEFTLRAVPIAQRRGRELQAGDLLLEKSGGGELQPVGKVVLYDLPYQAICSNFIARMRPLENYDSRFLNYLFDAAYAGRLNVNSLKQNTGIQNLDSDSYLSEGGAFPPLSEQRAIAAFLDRETARLDALIAKKERHIELLQEQRTALISRAVTKGLDANARMKDSGVEWLGEIPERWEIMFFKRIASVRYGLGQPPPQTSNGIPLVRATNIKSGKILEEGMIYIDLNEVPEGRNAILSEGEILVVRSGALTGDSAIVPKEYGGAVAGYDMVTTIRDGHSPYFAWQILSREVRELQFGFNSLRAAQPHLNAEELKSLIVVVPPIEEQRAIAAYLDRETTRLDALVSKIRASIERLREYRGALIAAAVTGKMDVRDM